MVVSAHEMLVLIMNPSTDCVFRPAQLWQELPPTVSIADFQEHSRQVGCYDIQFSESLALGMLPRFPSSDAISHMAANYLSKLFRGCGAGLGWAGLPSEHAIGTPCCTLRGLWLLNMRRG